MEVALDRPMLFDNMVTITPNDNKLLDNPGYIMHTEDDDKAVCFLTVGGQKQTITLAPKEVLSVKVKQVYLTGTAVGITVKVLY